jgi:hypothetical protein
MREIPGFIDDVLAKVIHASWVKPMYLCESIACEFGTVAPKER